jgi:hypothetical protein
MLQVIHGALLGLVLGGLAGAAASGAPGNAALHRLCIVIGAGCGGCIGAVIGLAAVIPNLKPVSRTAKGFMAFEFALAVVGVILVLFLLLS